MLKETVVSGLLAGNAGGNVAQCPWHVVQMGRMNRYLASLLARLAPRVRTARGDRLG